MTLRFTTSPADQRCVHPSLRKGPISLPVVASDEVAEHAGSPAIRASRNGRRRAIVLAAVQGLIIAHLVLWLLSRRYGWFGGATISPIEPSESMEFSKHGVINAGLIFFSIALLSTLILGRWFCGWGCHIVMLQDLCGWIMKRLGVRPRPFRSRFLIYVPLLLALYMFIWPAVYRWGVLPVQSWLATKVSWVSPAPHAPHWRVQSQVTTTEFWKTFPGVMVAIPFLFVCGFATVYFLGAKGFCTYGCPYGGFFAPLDKFAPGKIRVTDACEGCGHCTAVCTSNVRVHEEVREYGMVVDPGCMKCLDCVSVCPKEALYFGFGRPAVIKGAAINQPPQRKYDLTLREEFLFASVFALTFFCTRGVYGAVPMLMAAGLAGCVTFIAWKCWRMLRDPNVTLHRFQLKLRGRWLRAGWTYAAITTVIMALVVHSGAVKAANARAAWHDDRVSVPAELVFSEHPGAPTPDQRDHALRALRWYGWGSSIGAGGIGLLNLTQAEIDVRRAWLHCVLGEFDQAEAILRQAQARDQTESTAAALTTFLRSRHDDRKAQEATELYESLLAAHPEYGFMLAEYEAWALPRGRVEQVMNVHRARLQRDPKNRPSLRSMSMLLLQNGRYDEGLAMSKRWVDADPRSAEAHRVRAIGLAAVGMDEPAIVEMRLAVKYAPPGDTINRGLLAQMLDALGRTQEAAEVRAHQN